jgi:aspartyl/glutamyl-tRNA(Asn/Gln) amidotransferase C subunit
MKPIDKKTLKSIANKLMFDMEDSQYDTLLEEFSTIIEQMQLIGEIEGVDDATPMTFPYEVYTSLLREDVVEQPLDRDEALKNASDVVDGQIRLPKVVG